MKKVLLLLAILTTSFQYAQDLKKYIPSDAVFVGSFNMKNLLESVTISELDSSKMGQKILEKISGSTADSIYSFSEFDINTNGQSYFFYNTNDSISYFTMILPLRSNAFFEKKLNQLNVTDKGTYKIKSLDQKGSDYVTWDNEKAIFTSGTYNYSYFTDYDFSKIELELKLQQEHDSIAGVEDTVTVVDAVESPDTIRKKQAQNFEIEYDSHDVPYFKNYQIENYVYQYQSLGQNLKNALTEKNIKDMDDYLKTDIDNINYYIDQVDSIQESDAKKLDEFISNKEYFLKRRADSLSSEKLRKAALQIIKDATFYSDRFKVYPNVEESYSYNYDNNNYYKEKNELQKRWTFSRAESMMKPAKKSILLNNAYLQQIDKDAVMNIWSENYMASYMSSLGSVYKTLGLGDNIKDVFTDYGNLSGNLVLEDKKAVFNLDVALKGDLLKVTKSISKHKINPRFFNYINQDEFIGYISYNISMENALEQYPKVLTNVYGSMFCTRTAEIKVISELVSLLLDEKAVSELIEGDAVFLLSGIDEKEVTYTDYEYDENYNAKEVQKTKTETVPDFLFMMSSREKKFKNSLISYFLKRNYIKQIGNYYQITDDKGDLPVGIFFTDKDGIFFLTTSETTIKNIVTDSYSAKISSSLKKDIKRSQYSAYFNGKNFGSAVHDLNSFGGKMAKTLLKNATNFKMTSGLNKNDKVHTEIIMEVPSNKANAIKYILDLFDSLSE